MAGRATYINGVLHYSSDTAGAGVWGKTSITGQAAIQYGGELWFPFVPSTPAAAAAPPAPAPLVPPPPAEPQIPDPSLRGQTWGHVIPITAGLRTIPGRPVEIRLTKGADGHWVLDTLVSFGWRAEIMAGHPPVEFSFLKLTANGVVLYDATTGVTAPGVTLTWYNGTQVTADPFWEALNGAGKQPAYVYHILVNIVGLPLQNFNDSRPDAWAVTVKDGGTGAPITTTISAFGGFDGSDARMYGTGATATGNWTASTLPLYSLSSATGYATGAFFSGNAVTNPNTTGNYLGLYVPSIDRCIYTTAAVGDSHHLVFSLVHPDTGVVLANSEPVWGWVSPYPVRASTICYGMTGGATYLYITLHVAGGHHGAELQVFELTPTSITHVFTSGNSWDGNINGLAPGTVYSPISRGVGGCVACASLEDFYTTGDITLTTAQFNGSSIDYTTTVWTPPAATQGVNTILRGLLYRETTGTYLLAWKCPSEAGLHEFGGDLDVQGLAPDIWDLGSGLGNGSDSPFHPNSRCGDTLIFSNGGVLGSGFYNAMNLETGVISTINIPLPAGITDVHPYSENQAGDVAAFNSVSGTPRVSFKWSGTVLSTTGGVEGLTLARWFLLLGDLTRHIKGKVTVGANITDTLDSLFLVDTNTTFNRDGLAMCRVSNCDMRENNEGIEIVRGVEETTYVVNETLPERMLLRAPGQAGITFTRVGEDELPSEVVLQFIASEASFRFTERPARRELGPMPTTTSTKRETIKIQAGMPINQGQTWVSKTLYREIEARDQITYKLPWAYAIKVQAADIHIVPETQDSLGHIVKVTRADREANRLVQIQAQRLHTDQNYVGVADVGTSYPPFVAVEDLALTLGDIASTAVVFGPTIADAPLEIALGGIASSAVVFAPTFSGAAVVWTVTNGPLVLNINNTAAWAGQSIRQLIPASTLSTSGSKVRIRLVPTTTGSNTNIIKCYIGHAAAAGDAYDFDGGQVPVTFSGGAAGVTLTAGGASVVSDEIVFSLNEAKDLLISFRFHTTLASHIRRSSLAGHGTYYNKATGATDEAGTTDVSTYLVTPSARAIVDQVEVSS